MGADEPGALFQLLAENYVDPLFYAANGVVQWIAPSIESSLGWTPNEMRQLPLVSLVHGDDVQDMVRLLGQVGQGRPGRGVFRLRAKTGEYLWVLVTLGSTPDTADGRTVGSAGTVGSIREIQLRAEAERRLRDVAAQSSDVLITTGLDRRILWVSPAATRILQWESPELIGSLLDDLLDPDDRGLAEQTPLADALTGRQGVAQDPVEIRVRDRLGANHWMRLTASARHADDGSIEGLIVGLQDVDELVRARHRIAAAAERLQQILDSLPEVHAVLTPERDTTGHIIDFTVAAINEPGARSAGRTREEVIGRRVSEVMEGFVESALFDRGVAVMETGEPLVTDDFAYPAGDASGGVAYFSIRAVRVVDSLSVLWRDVTEHQNAVHALAASEEQYRLLAENATDVVIRLRDSIVLWVSPSLTDTLGWAPADWLGRDVHDFFHSDDLSQHDPDHAWLSTGETVTYRARLRAKDLSYHWTDISDGPFVNAQGETDGVVKSFRLVDNEVAAEAALEQRARFDELTGLANRTEALERIGMMTRRHRQPGDRTAVLFCDVDRFKDVNDARGHAAGDVVLRTLAQRINAAIRAGDTAARIGGDEMLAILEGVHDLDDALKVAEKIRESASLPIPVPGGQVSTSLSIGVTVAVPGESTDALVARADDAMYRAKQAGRNQVFTLDPSSP